jgi:hypothetical protein
VYAIEPQVEPDPINIDRNSRDVNVKGKTKVAQKPLSRGETIRSAMKGRKLDSPIIPVDI